MKKSEYSKEMRHKYYEKYRETERKWHEKNRERINAYMRNYYQENKETILARRRKGRKCYVAIGAKETISGSVKELAEKLGTSIAQIYKYLKLGKNFHGYYLDMAEGRI